MPELHAFPSHQLPSLPDPPSEELFRDHKRMPLDCCRDIIYSTAREIDEIEDAVPIFKLSRNKNPHVDLLKFCLDNVLIKGTDDAGELEDQFDELHLFEDVFYVTAVKIYNLYSDLKIRFANGFIKYNTPVVTGITAASMLDLLWMRWGAMFDLEVLATLNFAVRKENLFAFKTKHNAEVFLRSKRFKSRYTRPTINVSIRRALNRYAFNENELGPRIPGLHKLTEFNPAALAAHVQQKNSAALAAWDHRKEILEHASDSPALASRHDSMLEAPKSQSVSTINATNDRPLGAYDFSEHGSASPDGPSTFKPNRFLAGNDRMDVDQDAHEEKEEEEEEYEDEAMDVDHSAFADTESTQDDIESDMDFVLQPTTYGGNNTIITTPAATATPAPAQTSINHAIAAKKLNVVEKLKEIAGPKRQHQHAGVYKSKAAIRKENFIKKAKLELALTKARHSSLDGGSSLPSPLFKKSPGATVPDSSTTTTTTTTTTRPKMQLLAPTIYGQDNNTDDMSIYGGLTFGNNAFAASDDDTSKPKPAIIHRSRSPVMILPSTTAQQHLHDQQHNAGRLERHRGRALLKLEGKLQPDVDMKAWNYRDTCGCDDDCQCAYWCRKEPWHMCACQRPAARVRVTEHIDDDALSVASTIHEELWASWERETGRKKWW
ncbi:hypothetical protein IWX49DRAFT_549293 [Phyllosticta citricarpa]|uniref:Uncharacterized protein n=1 Tax=Phyllosticta citricarpa TaxID=55181 RepID=A0ABR1MR00_9PEZI